MTRFGRGIGRHPMPIPHSEDSETDEYNVIDTDRQYERIADRGSSTGTSGSSRSSNIGALGDPLIAPSSHMHNAHLYLHHQQKMSTLGKQQSAAVQQQQSQLVQHPFGHHPSQTHYAESAIYRRGGGGGSNPNGTSTLASPVDAEPPLIPESQLFMSGQAGQAYHQHQSSVNSLIDANGGGGGNGGGNWKSQHSTMEFNHQAHLNNSQQSYMPSNSAILSSLDSTNNSTSNGTTTTSLHGPGSAGSANGPVYESACLMRTASGSLYIPSDNKGAFPVGKPPLQSINEFTIGGTLKKPDR